MRRISLLLAGLLVCASSAWAQVPSPTPSAPIQMTQSYYALTPITATAAVNTQTTLTIPAPPTGLYNYICTLTINYSQSATTGTAQTNAVTTSTNFGGFALKFSAVQAINTNYDWTEIWGAPASGCAKSTSPSTATTFVSPAAAAQGAFTWTAVYFQAP